MSSLGVFVLVIGFTCGLSLADPSTRPATRPAATLSSNVVYGHAGGVDLKLDASVPPGDGPHPAVILVHGGSWQAGDKTQFHTLFEPLTTAGYAWFSINYRLAPKHKFPACVDDVETAVRWVKAHAAEYHVDPDRVALLGESAGGHLVELVAGRATKESGTVVNAVVAMYAPSDLQALADTLTRHGFDIGPVLNNLFGYPELDAAAKQVVRDASPIAHVHAGLPPFLLLHGTADRLVPYTQSTTFQAALRAVGVPCDLITVPNGGHGMVFWNTLAPTYREQMLAFLGKTLR